jgi:hypothetical protein
MSQPNPRLGCLVGGCFIILWCSIAFGMAITALQWGAPFIFAMVPFGMGFFGIVVFLAVAKSCRGAYPLPRRTRRDYVTYSGDSMEGEDTSYQREGKPSYQAPSMCPSCGADISTDEVDWVAPLKAVCPYCETVMDAVERSW